MSATSDQFELVEFEHVDAAPGTALLRLAARPSELTADGPLTLVLSDGNSEQRHEQLPSLPGPPGLLRAAFSAPSDQLAGTGDFALEFADGTRFQLPQPTRRRGGSASSHPGARPSAGSITHDAHDLGNRLAETEGRAEARRLAIIELEHRLQSERDRRTAAEAELTRVRTERDDALAAHDSAVFELEEACADRDQAEARARAAAANAGSLQAQVRAVEDDVIRARTGLETELGDRTAELQRLRSSAEAAQARAHMSRREAVALEEQLENLRSQVEVLEQTLDQRRNDDATAAIARRNAEIEILREELASRNERLQELFARTAGERAKSQTALEIARQVF